VLGHEFAGVVTAVGEGVTEPVPGHRVAVDTIVYCGTCHWCRRGEVIRCPLLGALGLHADGGLAEICNAPARMCLPVPDSVADDEAALAEPLAVAVRALRTGGRAVVLGIGTRPATVPPLDLVVGEKSIIGSLSHVWDEDFRIALGLLGRGAVQAAPLISDRIPLSAAVSGGLALLRDEPAKHVKILVQPEEPG
jgi:threonine dehydrogenase-like Zn-dependent dehydrogenase